MTVKVNIKADKLKKNLKRKEHKITKSNLSVHLSNVYAKILRTVVSQRSAYPSGNLADSIKVKKLGRYGSGVYAADYFWYANYGRGAGGHPPDYNSVNRFVDWANMAGIDPVVLSNYIAKEGTHPTYFYEASIQILQAQKPRAYKKIIKYINR